MEMDICDNLIFAVNGSNKERFKMALKLAINDEPIIGYRIDKNLGLILYSSEPSDKKIEKFLMPSSIDSIVDQLYDWVMDDNERLKLSLEIDKFYYDNNIRTRIVSGYEYIIGWNKRNEGIENKKGWVIYKNDWGAISNWNSSGSTLDYYAICAIAPAWLWIGK